MALPVGDLVDPEPVQPVQPFLVQMVGHHPADGLVDAHPRGAHQPGHAGLVHPLGQPADHVLEVPGEPGPGPGPGHLLGAHPPAAWAPNPCDRGPQLHPHRPEVQVPPAPLPLVMQRPRTRRPHGHRWTRARRRISSTSPVSVNSTDTTCVPGKPRILLNAVQTRTRHRPPVRGLDNHEPRHGRVRVPHVTGAPRNPNPHNDSHTPSRQTGPPKPQESHRCTISA